MSTANPASAYLITVYILTASGEVVEDGGTICFDYELALEMAEADLAAGVGLGVSVYALDEQGQPVGDGPVFSSNAFGMTFPRHPVQPQGPHRGSFLWGSAPSTFM